MRRSVYTAVAAAAAITAIVAAVALAAPVSSKPPTITGKPDYAQTLTCNRGAWSSDAVSFTYAWAISGGSTIATGQSLEVPQSAIGFTVVCIVTAHDRRGQTTPASSAQVLIGQGISTVKITKATAHHGLVTISGTVGPAAARRKGLDGWSTVVLDRELSSRIDVQQISNGPKIVRARNGSFSVSGHDTRGKHTYVVNFDPSAGSGYAPGSATRRLTVH
ncbi:MAG TPA: hypothetical protein VMF14_18630 [Solirubrobacteraceae bacterium]|nr:hypothetical protein [Solirubrobacteraceae bacterium]